MKKDFLTLIAGIALAVTSGLAYADDVDAGAIMSPNCDADQIKDIAGDALLSISKNQSWGDEVKGYIVKLDTNKMSYNDLTRKMMQANCFDK